MPLSPAQEKQMFGITREQVVAEKPERTGAGMWAMSILSDVQGLLELDGSARARERARQWINQAKYWIDTIRGRE